MKQICRKAQISIFLFILTILTTGCGPGPILPENENLTSLEEKTYIIEPSTILQSLAEGKAGVFTLLTSPTPAVDLPFNPTPVKWKQSDYFFVASALFRFEWNETPENWKLRQMGFSSDCRDSSQGFQGGIFEFFKIVQTPSGDSRLVRMLFISPGRNNVSLSYGEYNPVSNDWGSIDLGQVKVTVDDALKIAEENGGADFRAKASNDCVIRANYNPDGRYNGWVLGYSSMKLPSFAMEIDAQTGVHKIIR